MNNYETNKVQGVLIHDYIYIMIHNYLHTDTIRYIHWLKYVCTSMSNPAILIHRANVLKSMLLTAGELKDKESYLNDRMDPVVASINRHKQLILLDELWQSVHHPDLSIIKETLDLMSGDISKKVLDRVMTSSESNLEGELYEVTKDGVKKPADAIKQGQKLKAIDDYTFSGVNACVGCYEKVYLQGVDYILSLVLELARRSKTPS